MSVHAVGSLSLAIRKESSRINKRILKYLPYKDIDQWLQTFLFSRFRREMHMSLNKKGFLWISTVSIWAI